MTFTKAYNKVKKCKSSKITKYMTLFNSQFHVQCFPELHRVVESNDLIGTLFPISSSMHIKLGI